jgi:hypothetical protein
VYQRAHALQLAGGDVCLLENTATGRTARIGASAGNELARPTGPTFSETIVPRVRARWSSASSHCTSRSAFGEGTRTGIESRRGGRTCEDEGACSDGAVRACGGALEGSLLDRLVVACPLRHATGARGDRAGRHCEGGALSDRAGLQSCRRLLRGLGGRMLVCISSSVEEGGGGAADVGTPSPATELWAALD